MFSIKPAGGLLSIDIDCIKLYTDGDGQSNMRTGQIEGQIQQVRTPTSLTNYWLSVIRTAFLQLSIPHVHVPPRQW